VRVRSTKSVLFRAEEFLICGSDLLADIRELKDGYQNTPVIWTAGNEDDEVTPASA